jgi:general secretion pathway protein H
VTSAVKPANGFTLIEVLVVVVIVGIAASLVMLSGRAMPQRQLDAEVERLLRVMSIARDEAEVTGQPLVLEVSAKGYAFRQRDRAGQWRAPADDVLRPRAWPLLVSSVTLVPEAQAGRVLFEPGGRAQPFTLQIDADGRRVAIAGDLLGRHRLVPVP